MLLKKHRPFVINQNTVGLERIDYCLFTRVYLLKFDRPSKKWQPHQRWFPSLPGKNHLIHILCGDMLFDKQFKRIFRHPVIGFSLRIELLFLQVKTIFTIQIAYRTRRFNHDLTTFPAHHHSSL